MPLPINKQLDLAMQSVAMGDMDLLEKILTDPAATTIDEQRTFAEKMGIKKGFLSAAVNTFTDPVVLVSFLMSKRFPTLAWLKGTIPERFIGTANEFTGVSQFTRPVEQYFRGTTVPRLVALQAYREAKVRDIGAEMLKVMERPNWKAEMPVVSQLLEGQQVAGATPELIKVSKFVRTGMDDIWNLLKGAQKIEGGFVGEEIIKARSVPYPPAEAPRYLRDYLPHIPLLGEGSVVEMNPKDALRAMGKGKTAQVFEVAQANPNHVWTIDASNRLASDYSRYQEFLNKTQGRVYNPNLFHRKRMNIPLQSFEGQELFVTDLNVIMQKYVQSAARTYALNTPITAHEQMLASVLPENGVRIYPSRDPIVVQVINEGLKTTGAKMVQRPVAGTNIMDEHVVLGQENPHVMSGLRNLVRNMMGHADEGEILMGNLFSSIGAKFDQATKTLGYKQKAQVDYTLRKLQRDRQFRSINNGIVSYFYSTTLGLNPWSAIQNTLQPLLTTAPAIGMGPTLRGVREMGSKIGTYSRELRNQIELLKSTRPGTAHVMDRINTAAERAFNTSFPELAHAGLKLDPRLFDINPNSVAAFGNKANKFFKTADDYLKFMLQPFRHAELANQATTFYGARNRISQAMKTGEYEIPRDMAGNLVSGAALEDVLNFEASNIVNATQFRPGPGSRSIMQSKLPAALRMFTSFPTRALSFMTESTVRGALTANQLEQAGTFEKLLGGRNWGTLARMMLIGRIAQHGLRDTVGVDLDNALGITAPFMIAPPGEFLAPLPVSPVAGAVVGLVRSATNRDIKYMKPMRLPGVGEVPIPKTLFPGGVGISRMVKAVQHYRPDLGGFTDDDERLMYMGNTGDLVLSMLGIPTEKNRRTREYMDRITDVRMRVRDYRRQYANAYANYDMPTMSKLERSWSEKFPDWPPLTITGKDARRYKENAQMPMLQRMMQTMGQAGRFLESDIYEVDPDLIMPSLMQGGQ